MAFEKEINDYENLRTKYQTVVVDRMDREEYRQFNEILFSTHSCAIEGNSFSVDDTRELKEKGLGMIPTGKSLLEAFEMYIERLYFLFVTYLIISRYRKTQT